MAKLDSVTIADPAAKIASAAVIEMRAFDGVIAESSRKSTLSGVEELGAGIS